MGARAIVAPTAAAHEGDESFDGWANKGLEHYAGLGIPAEVLPLKTREDAHRDDLVRRLDDASIVFFSGGNPARLAGLLRDTRVRTTAKSCARLSCRARMPHAVMRTACHRRSRGSPPGGTISRNN